VRTRLSGVQRDARVVSSTLKLPVKRICFESERTTRMTCTTPPIASLANPLQKRRVRHGPCRALTLAYPYGRQANNGDGANDDDPDGGGGDMAAATREHDSCLRPVPCAVDWWGVNHPSYIDPDGFVGPLGLTGTLLGTGHPSSWCAWSVRGVSWANAGRDGVVKEGWRACGDLAWPGEGRTPGPSAIPFGTLSLGPTGGSDVHFSFLFGLGGKSRCMCDARWTRTRRRSRWCWC
jgi:hypothetical protein